MFNGGGEGSSSTFNHGTLRKIVLLLFFLSFSLQLSSSNGDQAIGSNVPDSNLVNSRALWSYNYSSTTIGPYDWSHIRVELPPRFSFVSVALITNGLNEKRLRNYPKDQLPMMCLREGSPPIPDLSEAVLQSLVVDHFNGSAASSMQFHQNSERCFVLQRNINFTLTNEQVQEGILYISLFNGLGPIRTRAKMINSGNSYSFSGIIAVNSCKVPSNSGQFCDNTLDELPCITQSNPAFQNQMSQIPSSDTCRNNQTFSQQEMGQKLVFLNLKTVSEQLTITVKDIKLNQSALPSDRGLKLFCYARNGAIPTADVYDYSTNLINGSLIINSPKMGTWFFLIELKRTVGFSVVIQDAGVLSYSMEWEALSCPEGTAGLNCSWKRYIVEADYGGLFININNTRFGFSDLPMDPLLSYPVSKEEKAFAWTYFVMGITPEVAGKNINIKLASNSSIKYEIYARFGGLPSLDAWDYYYANLTSNSNNAPLFKSYGLTQQSIDFNIIYPQEGPWILGLRHPITNVNSPSQTNVSLSVQSCPHGCSGNGECQPKSCSFCWCDRYHGGFDCSIELVPKTERKWQAIFLVVSNAVALFPSACSFWQKSFAEGIVFLASGSSSAVYHACDVGWKCLLPYSALQFLDFWLSFVAVISIFVHMAYIKESTRRTILTMVWILTAVMAIDGPTRSNNIIFVAIIGTICLLVGFLVEILTKRKSICNIFRRRSEARSVWFRKLVNNLHKRFSWWFILFGGIGLGMAAISWKLEDIDNYWIWHSVWHMSMFGAAFFFLCFKVKPITNGECLKAVNADRFPGLPANQSPETIPLSTEPGTDIA